MPDKNTVHDICKDILMQHPASKQLFIGIGYIIIQIKSNSEPLLSELRTYFKEFISWESHADIIIHAIEANIGTLPYVFEEKQPDPGKTKIKEEFINLEDGRIVRKRLTDMILLFNGRYNLAVGPCLANSNQVVNFINNRFIEWMLRRGSLLAHASGVCSQSRGLAIAGFSGTGKSSLALRILDRGAYFVSNDRLMMNIQRGQLRMYGIPKHPRVNPGTLLSLPALDNIIDEQDRADFVRLPPDELWNLEKKYDVIIDAVFGQKKFHLHAPMNGLLIINWRKLGADLIIRRIDIAQRRDLLSAFIKSPGLFFLPESGKPMPDFTPERYLDFLQTCDVFEASGGVDFEQATTFCLNYLNHGAPGE